MAQGGGWRDLETSSSAAGGARLINKPVRGVHGAEPPAKSPLKWPEGATHMVEPPDFGRIGDFGGKLRRRPPDSGAIWPPVPPTLGLFSRFHPRKRVWVYIVGLYYTIWGSRSRSLALPRTHIPSPTKYCTTIPYLHTSTEYLLSIQHSGTVAKQYWRTIGNVYSVTTHSVGVLARSGIL
jgi:hypothetical protein